MKEGEKARYAKKGGVFQGQERVFGKLMVFYEFILSQGPAM